MTLAAMEPYPRRRTRTPTLGLVPGLALLLLLAACGGEEGEGDFRMVCKANLAALHLSTRA